jgi:hypothetical protein
MIWKGKHLQTYGDIIEAIRACSNQTEAQDFLCKYTVYCGNNIKIAESNIGYLAGYLSKEEAIKIFELFHVTHPIFGDTWPTPEEAFEMGQKYGKMCRALD